MRRLVFSVIAWLVCAHAWAASVVQTKVSNVDSLSSSPSNYSFTTNPTTGNTLIAVVPVAADSSTIAVSDGTNGSWTSIVSQTRAGTGTSAILAKRNATGGALTVAVTSSVTGNGVVFLYEVSGLDNAVAITSSSNDESATTSHACGSAGLSGTGFTVCGAILGAGTGAAAGSGFTKLTTPSEARFSQYKVGTVSSETGPYTTSGSELAADAIARFVDATASPGGRRRGLLGVGR